MLRMCTCLNKRPNSCRSTQTYLIIPTNVFQILDALNAGDTFLLDDGKLKMTVTEKGNDYINCIVDVGGMLGDKKVR